MNAHDTGPEPGDLLSRLRAADPAASLPPADPDRVTHLLEAAMTDTTIHTHETRENGTHDRSPLTWLVAAAAVILFAVAGVFGLVNRDHDRAPCPRTAAPQPRPTAAMRRGPSTAARSSAWR